MENQIDIVLKAIDDASSTIKKVSAQLEVMAAKANNSTKKMQAGNAAGATSFMSLGRAIMTSAAAYASFSAAKWVLKLTSQVEQARIGFTTLLKSEEAALKMLKDIDYFASKTPFEKITLIPLVQQLMGMGFEANQALPVMNVLGDSVAALGKGEDSLKSIVTQLGQMRTKGVVLGQDMRILAENGLPVYDILKEKLKLTEDQLVRVGEAGIKASIGIPALLTGLNERFGGAMQAQNKTLLGQWSNLMDNLKSMVGTAWQTINTQVTGWIKSVNNFFDANRPVITKFMQDVFMYASTTARAVGQLWGVLGGAIGDLLAAVTGDTEQSTQSQAKSWSLLFLVIAQGVSVISGGLQFLIKTVVGAVKVIASIVKGIFNVIVTNVANMIIGSLASLETLANGAIKVYNLFAKVAGGSLMEPLTLFTNAAKKSSQMAADSFGKAGGDIAGAWAEMSAGMESTNQNMITNLLANQAQYEKAIAPGGAQSTVFTDIEKSLEGLKAQLEKATAGHNAAKAGAKGQEEALKKLKTAAEDALKPVIDKIEESQKAVEETQKKIKDLAGEWTKYKNDAIKAISEVNNELAKLKKEAGDIALQSDMDRDVQMGERLVDVMAEIAQKKKDIAENQSSQDQTNQSIQETMDMQAELLALEKERDFIKGNISQKVIEETAAYAELSQAQKIAADAEKEKQRLLTENAEKQAALMEKRMILEQQANQKSIADLGIMIGTKDGMLTASILDEKGNRVEIHNEENIALANEIATKQAQYKADAEALTLTLQEKLTAQNGHIALVQQMYTDFNKFLKKDTADTAQSMISTLWQVTIELQKVIALRKSAGFGSVQAVVPVDGAKADGGPVESWKTYLVGERGPELFIPRGGGTIIPNEKMGGGAITVHINMGGVSVRNEGDVQKMAQEVAKELTRQLETYKLWVV